MQLTWFPVNAINPLGESYKIEDPAIWPTIWPDMWERALAEFDISKQVGANLKGEVWVLPQEEGCLVRGHLVGVMNLLCARCTEDVEIKIDHKFDTFEPFPAASVKRLTDIAPGKTHDKGRRRNEEKQARLLEEIAKRDEIEIDPDVDEEVMRAAADGHGVEINLAALLWQELVLAMPIKVLCGNNCKGICPECGENLNTGPCPCDKAVLDPRLAILRDIKIDRK